ncbi:MAG: DUF4349 domain-containing protein [Janthinobacterium lividum]
MHDVIPRHRPTRLLVPALALALTLVLGVAGCSGSGAGSGSSGDASSAGSQAGTDVGAGMAAGGDVAAAASVGAAAGAASPTAVDAAAQARSVVSTATVAVRVDDLPAASAALQRRVLDAGGLVTSSRNGTSVDDRQAQLTLRVPSTAFEATLDAVAALGEQTERSTTAADVTAEVADVDSRVTSAQAVLVTFRQRLPQAVTIPDILAIENEIATRQADLEALQARQRVLADQVALATIDVALTEGAPTSLTAADQPGFTGGLSVGWHALGRFLRVATLVVGAVLPFLLPVAIVGVPLLVLRRRRARPAPGTPS